MKILVYAEQRNGKLKSSALEALTAALNIAGDNPANVAALVIGSGVEGLAGELKGHGADKIYVADNAAFQNYNCLHYTAALEAAVKAFGAQLVVGIASPMGKDLFPRLAARMEAGILTDVTSVKVEGDSIKCKKPMYAGKVIANVALKSAPLRMISLRPNVFAANNSGKGAGAVEKLNVTPQDANLVTKEIRKGKSEKPDLTEAGVIISGGRSIGSADNFKVLNECAEVIGATVGASRAAVDSGYASHDMQVGQTGKTVNPNLYIACGISGSIQHMAGMRTSKVIVSVNTDPEAPIMGISDYAIVADLFQAVPIFTQEFKKIL